MFKDKELKAIKIVNADTGEILAIIQKDNDVICKNEYNVILDYTKDDEKTITEIDGKFYELAYVEKEVKANE